MYTKVMTSPAILFLIALCVPALCQHCVNINLASQNHEYAEKRLANPVSSIILNNRVSNSACVYGTSFGKDGRKVWVNDGCRGNFGVCIMPVCENINLSSRGFRYAERTMGSPVTSISLNNQVSNSACTLSTSYGRNGRKVWVDSGCRGNFNVCRLPSCQNMDLASNNYALSETRMNTPVTSITLNNQVSRSTCTPGTTFGKDGKKVFVNNGCRGNFKVCTA